MAGKAYKRGDVVEKTAVAWNKEGKAECANCGKKIKEGEARWSSLMLDDEYCLDCGSPFQKHYMQ